MARPLTGNKPEVEEWFPNALDRCDYECPAQAMVKATGMYSELLFCHHHYQQIVQNNSKINKLKAFAFDIQDRSSVLEVNRLKEGER